MEEALYLPDGDRFVATLLCQGGWDPDAQHGGAVQALLARCVERVPSLAPMQVARLTFDLVRPVPMGRPLGVRHTIVREGKKIQLVDTVLSDGDTPVALARTLRLRRLDLSHDAELPGPGVSETPPPDTGTVAGDAEWGVLPGFLRGIELRRVEPEGHGGHLYWVRPRVPVVAGEEVSPLTLLALAGDFVNLIGMTFGFTRYTAINPDVSVQVLREPVGEWVAVVGDTRLWPPAGLGRSEAELRDATGVVGHATCSQLIQPR